MEKISISFIEQNDIAESAKVLSEAMLNVPLHIAVFQGHGEKERSLIEKMFFDLFSELPGITLLAKINGQIVGAMRMKSCMGRQVSDESAQTGDVSDLDWRQSIWHNEWARHDPPDQHWHLGPVGVLPAHQGKGIGRKLMKEVLGKGRKAGLHTVIARISEGNEISVHLHRAMGFKHIGIMKEVGKKFGRLLDVHLMQKLYDLDD